MKAHQALLVEGTAKFSILCYGLFRFSEANSAVEKQRRAMSGGESRVSQLGDHTWPNAVVLSEIHVGDERDIVAVRTNHRRESVYLYRLNSSPQDARRLLMVYLERINELADRPEWYHLLSNSCTINIIRYLNAAGRQGRFDIRHLLNGLIDSYLYHSGRVDTSMPFEELRRRSLINSVAQAAERAGDFSARIRASLPMPSTRAP